MIDPSYLVRELKKHYSAEIALEHGDPLQLLISTMLSAQCTDERVNKVTKSLFKEYRSVRDYAGAEQKKLEEHIHSTGFYHSKARNIISAAKMIVSDYNGIVPDSMEELVKLPGVARKTANIVLSAGYGKSEGIAVDTHVKRLSYRMGLSKNKDPNKVEQDLMKLFPKNEWADFNFRMVLHGRALCFARKPLCGKCFLKSKCPKRSV